MNQQQTQQPLTLDGPTLHAIMEDAHAHQSYTGDDMHAMMGGLGYFGDPTPYNGLPSKQDTTPVDPSSIQSYAKQQSDSMFGQGHWDSLNRLINNESGWNPQAQNPGSTAYGLGQFLDSTWAGVGAQKTSDPQAQVDDTLKYIQQRYGDPTKALDFWNNVAPTMSAGNGSHWY